MKWSDIPLRPSPRTLRQFAFIGLGVFTALALIQAFVFRHPVAALILGGLAAAFGAAGLVRPAVLRPVFAGMMIVTFPVNWLVTHLILAALFYGVFTPLGVMFKLIGRDALGRRFRPELDSYWAPKTTSDDIRGYFRQS